MQGSSLLPCVSSDGRPLMGLGFIDAMAEFHGGLVELALILLDLRAADPTRHYLLAVARESSLAYGFAADHFGLVEAVKQPQQRNFLVQCGETAQGAELGKARLCGRDVDNFAQGDCVVANDDAQEKSSAEKWSRVSPADDSGSISG